MAAVVSYLHVKHSQASLRGFRGEFNFKALFLLQMSMKQNQLTRICREKEIKLAAIWTSRSIWRYHGASDHLYRVCARPHNNVTLRDDQSRAGDGWMTPGHAQETLRDGTGTTFVLGFWVGSLRMALLWMALVCNQYD